MSGGAIPANKYRSSTLFGFRHPVTDLHALFSYVFDGNSSRFLNVAALEMS